jgi:hypothetical protein
MSSISFIASTSLRRRYRPTVKWVVAREKVDLGSEVQGSTERCRVPHPCGFCKGAVFVLQSFGLISLDEPLFLWYSSFWVQLQLIPVLACAHLPLANVHNFGAI